MYYKKVKNGKCDFLISVNQHAKTERRIDGKSTHEVSISCLINANVPQYKAEIEASEITTFINITALDWIEQQAAALTRRGKSDVEILLTDAGFATNLP